jgi:hypothetical protein
MAGSAALGRGISSGLQSLGAGIQAAMEKKKQEASLATTLRKKLSIIQPERKDEFATMGLADLAGEDLGHAEKIITARNAQHEQLQAEKLAELISRRQGREALPRVYEELSQMGQQPENVPAPLNNAEFDRRTMPLGPEALMSALARSRAPVEMNEAASLMNALEKGTARSRVPTTAKLAGRDVVYSPDTGAFQVLTDFSDANPDRASERTLSDGTVQSWNGTRWVNASKPPRVSPDFTKSLGELAIGLDDPKNAPKVRAGIKAMIDSAHTLNQLNDTQRSALYSQFGIGSGAPAAGPDGAPASERVTVEKGGKRFTLPKSQVADAEKQGYKLVK